MLDLIQRKLASSGMMGTREEFLEAQQMKKKRQAWEENSEMIMIDEDSGEDSDVAITKEIIAVIDTDDEDSGRQPV